MTPALASRITAWAWIAWLAYWMVAASKAKRTRRRDTPVAMLTARVFMLLAAVVYFAPRSWFGPFSRRFVSATPAVLWCSLALTFLGLGYSIWARIILAGNWSSTIELKAGNELVRAGPYSHIRHPIYTGIMIAGIGAVLLRGSANSFVAFVLLSVGFWAKARREESLLAREFGAALDSYREATGMFLPRPRLVTKR